MPLDSVARDKLQRVVAHHGADLPTRAQLHRCLPLLELGQRVRLALQTLDAPDPAMVVAQQEAELAAIMSGGLHRTEDVDVDEVEEPGCALAASRMGARGLLAADAGHALVMVTHRAVERHPVEREALRGCQRDGARIKRGCELRVGALHARHQRVPGRRVGGDDAERPRVHAVADSLPIESIRTCAAGTHFASLRTPKTSCPSAATAAKCSSPVP